MQKNNNVNANQYKKHEHTSSQSTEKEMKQSFEYLEYIKKMFDELVVSTINKNTNNAFDSLNQKIGFKDDDNEENHPDSLVKMMRESINNTKKTQKEFVGICEKLFGDEEIDEGSLYDFLKESIDENIDSIESLNSKIAETQKRICSDLDLKSNQIKDELSSASADISNQNSKIISEINRLFQKQETIKNEINVQLEKRSCQINDAITASSIEEKNNIEGILSSSKEVAEDIISENQKNVSDAISRLLKNASDNKTEIIQDVSSAVSGIEQNLAKETDEIKTALYDNARIEESLVSENKALRKLIYALISINGVSLVGIVLMVILNFLQ